MKSTTKRKELSMLEILPMVAAEAGNFGPYLPLAFAGLGAGVGVGIVGGKAAEAVGRNPSAFGSILVMAIIGMALSEAIAIYGLLHSRNHDDRLWRLQGKKVLAVSAIPPE
jgi:F-type H+-transporting ATPase subunit c